MSGLDLCALKYHCTREKLLQGFVALAINLILNFCIMLLVQVMSQLSSKNKELVLVHQRIVNN